MTTNNLEKRIEAIENRNRRVALDKAWEKSWVRRVSIAILTYFVVLAYLFVIGNDRPLINAIVPATGYLLSTLAMTWIRKMWQRGESER